MGPQTYDLTQTEQRHFKAHPASTSPQINSRDLAHEGYYCHYIKTSWISSSNAFILQIISTPNIIRLRRNNWFKWTTVYQFGNCITQLLELSRRIFFFWVKAQTFNSASLPINQDWETSNDKTNLKKHLLAKTKFPHQKKKKWQR